MQTDTKNSDKSLLLDVKEVASLLNCSARHVYRMSDMGKLPRPMKLGALVRWNRSAIEQFVVDQSEHGERKERLC